jgi:L-amino acid N-acyltransferase
MVCVRDAQHKDLLQILNIYNAAVVSSAATFDLEPITLEQRREWFRQHHPQTYPILVATQGDKVVGYACLSPFRDKPAYRKSVESSIYVDPDYQGRGIGKTLLEAILRRATEIGYHTVIAGITGGNDASIQLHRKFGFEPVGCFREVGYKFDQWHDVYFYQLMLNTEPHSEGAVSEDTVAVSASGKTED